MREDALTVHVPMAFRRRGGRKLIVAPDGTSIPAAPPRFNVDNVLVKALARGFRWRKLLDDRTYSTIKEIAVKERIDASYVADVLRLTLLAPDVVEMILDGRQPPGWQLHRLRKSSARVAGAARGLAQHEIGWDRLPASEPASKRNGFDIVSSTQSIDSAALLVANLVEVFDQQQRHLRKRDAVVQHQDVDGTSRS
jgi:hypothetical protein